MTFSPKVWSDALRRLQQEIPDFTIDAWIKPLAVKIDEQRLVLGCPNSFHRDRVRLHHFEALERCWTEAAQVALASEASSTATTVSVLTLPEFAEAAGREVDAQQVYEERTSNPTPGRMRKVETSAAIPAERVSNGSDAYSSPVSPSPIAPTSRSVGSGSGTAAHLTTSAAQMPAPVARNTQPGAPAGVEPVAPQGLGNAWLTAPTATPADHAGADRGFGPTGSSLGASTATPPSTSAKQAQKAAGPIAISAPRPPRGPKNDLSFDLEGAGPASAHPFSFESFIVGPCNALAREATLALARKRQQSLNQLYLGSASGMGKTHLAKAAAIEARRMLVGGRGAQRGASGVGRVIYTTAEQFTTDFVSAMRHNRNDEWTKRYRGPIELLIVEDIPCLAGRTKTQEELAQTLRHVLDSGGRVLLTGDRPPRELTNLDEGLRAQVERGFVAELDRPDALVRRHLLRAKAAAGGVHLPSNCLDLLVQATGQPTERGAGKSSASVRDLEGMLIQVVTTASLLGKPIDLDLTQEAVDLKSGVASALEPAKLSISEVVEIVAAFFGKRPEALASRSRRRDVLVPRQLAMYLAHRHTESTLSEIGRALSRDHPAVRNAITRVERQVLENAPLRYQIEALSERLDQRRQECVQERR